MKYGLYGAVVPLLLDGILKDYLKKELPEVDRKVFMKNLKKEYRSMVERTEDIGKDNIFRMTMYMACYGFSVYKADPEVMNEEKFAGFIHALSYSKLMEKAYKGKDPFSKANVNKYAKGALRSQKGQYPMDWKFTFESNPEVPEYFITHTECGVCKLGQKEGLFRLVKYMCTMDYAAYEFQGVTLLRTKTIGNGDDCCDFHVVKGLPNNENCSE